MRSNVGIRVVSEGGLEPPCPLRALAPQASASAYSATRTHLDVVDNHSSRITIANQVTTVRDANQTGVRDPVLTRHRVAALRWHYGRMTTIIAKQEVAGLASDLIRIDTTNTGDDSGPGERVAAEHVAGLLAEIGLEPTLLESRKNRASVVTRIEGADPSRPALLIHGHLDVVPADPADWRVHPFSGETQDDCIWGRGAVDMKDMDAMMLAVVRQRLREGRRPPRDVVLAFPADEEAGGTHGARWLVDNHPDLFEGVTEAVGEVGGFSTTLGSQRLYLLQTAEKGMAWLRLTARGTAGHGSMVNPDNAVTELAEAIGRLGRHEWPVRLIPSVQAFLEGASQALGTEFAPNDPGQLLSKIGSVSRIIGATLHNTVNPTVLKAGYKVNVVPQDATAEVDGRFLPGYEEEFLA